MKCENCKKRMDYGTHVTDPKKKANKNKLVCPSCHALLSKSEKKKKGAKN